MNKKRIVALSLTIPLLLAGCDIRFATSSDTTQQSSILPSSSQETVSSSSSSAAIASSAPSSSQATVSSVPSSSETISSSVEPVVFEKDVAVEMVAVLGAGKDKQTFIDNWHYTDGYFLEDSQKENTDLAVMSVMADGASSCTNGERKGAYITSLLEEIGFLDIQKNRYYEEGIFQPNSMGVVIGRKTIEDRTGKPYTLLGVFPRNSGYRDEWAGDFDLGATGIHKGFKLARDEVLRFLKQYILSNKVSGDLKVWIAGYSRGAATANLVGGYLAEESGYFDQQVRLDPKDLYVYTIATPATLPNGLAKKEVLSVGGPRGEGYFDTDVEAYVYHGAEGTVELSADRYQGIHNYAGIGDYVTKLPPSAWGFSRYGKTEEALFGSEAMVANLAQYSPETAAAFANGRTYVTETEVQTFDLNTFTMVNTGKKQSANGLLDERINAVMREIGSRENFENGGYGKGVGAIVAAIGIDTDAVMPKLTSNIPSLVKAGILNYLSHVIDTTGLSESQAIAKLIAAILGKTEEEAATYTDQQFLADLLDFAINDYQTKPEASARATALARIIPAPYGDLFLKVLDFAKANKIAPKTTDGFIYLLAKFVADNAEDETVLSALDAMIAALPEDYRSYLGLLAGLTGKTYSDEDYPDENTKNKVVLLDTMQVMAYGVYDEDGVQTDTAETQRYLLFHLLGMTLLPDKPYLQSLILNGMQNDNGEMIENEPVALDLLIEDILNLVLPKDEAENRVGIKDLADQRLLEALDQIKTDENEIYVEEAKQYLNPLREAFMVLLFNPGETFDFSAELDNAVAFINALSFIAPAHFPELYLSYMKARAGA